jgi:hypothetical protein
MWHEILQGWRETGSLKVAKNLLVWAIFKIIGCVKFDFGFGRLLR